MTLIDWAYLGAHFLWIFGLSLMVASFSYHSWLNQERGRPLYSIFSNNSWRAALNIGLSLMFVSITVMPRSERWWTRLAALIVALVCLAVGVRAWRLRRSG